MLLSLSILSCSLLLGCNTEKNSYKGPVQGSAKIAKANDTAALPKSKEIQPTIASTAVSNATIFGEDQRFVSQSPDVTEKPLYKYSPAYDYEFGHLVVSGKLDFQNLGQPE